jgi:hypothetical protein
MEKGGSGAAGDEGADANAALAVSHESIASCEAFAAVGKVSLRFIKERKSAPWAGEGLSAGMYALVPSQIVLADESRSTATRSQQQSQPG